MRSSSKLIRIVGIVLITFLSAGYTPNPDPEPVNTSFVSVFDSKRKRADRYFNNFEYNAAIKLYNKIVKKGKADDDVKLRLAESYLKINDPVNAEKWFSEVIHSDRITPQHQIQYAHTLVSNGKYQEARQVIDMYEFAQSDYRSKAIINTLDKLDVLYADSMFYQLNTVADDKPQYSDFSPTVYKNGIVFVSSRHDKGPKFKWDDTPFLDLYYTETDVASAKPFSETLNSKYHEGPITFYDNFTKAVFTRSNYLDKELGMTEEGINNLQLYTATWNQQQNDWDQINPVNFTLENYSYGHPTISADNQKLYFVSDMPGGYGGTDIYVSERNETGWGDPANMGEVINTPGNEMYPFIDIEDNLYFSSNGHGGLGGLDVYQIVLGGNMDLRNMGYPLNTTADDFGFSLTPNGEIAYISSNREGPDNIFQIDIKAPNLEMILADNSINSEVPNIADSIEPLATSELSTMPDLAEYDEDELSTINASIIDENNEILENANFKLMVNGEETTALLSDVDGKVSIQVPPDQEYTIVATKDGFEDRIITIPAQSLGQEEDLLIVMNSIFVDSDLPGDQPATELEPLAVNGDSWEDISDDQNEKPLINGVALAALPELSDENNEELPTTELDPLAVTDDGWEDSSIEENNRPDIQGVALTEMPTETEGALNEDQATELDPLAVSADSWDDASLSQSEKPAINGVALAALPELSDENNEELPTTELDPLAVSDDGWEDSSIEENNRPDIQGVALTEMPTETEGALNEDQATELDPLAVSADSWDDAALSQSEKPAINGVALAAPPALTAENNEELSTTELDPLAVSDEGWQDSSIEGNNRPDIQGVALTEMPGDTEDALTDDPTTELDPLAVTDEGWDDNSIQGNHRPAVQGVALSQMPGDTNGTSNEGYTSELDPLAVSGENLHDTSLDQDENPAINGVALTETPDTNSNLSNQGHVLEQNQIAQPESDLGLPRESNQQLDDNSDLIASSESQNALLQNEMSESTSENIPVEGQLVEAVALDSKTGVALSAVDIKLFVDSPNETIEYDIKDGVLTFNALPEENYIIVASHDHYQDQFINLSGDKLLKDGETSVDLGLSRNEDIASVDDETKGPSTKFKALVRDEKTNNLLSDAEVKFFVDGKAIESEYSKENGKTVFKSPQGEDYMMLVSRKGYQDLIYHLPGTPDDNLDVELAMLRAEDFGPQHGYQQLAVRERTYDQLSGADLDNVTFKVFENGELIKTTDDLSTLEIDPEQQYNIVASRPGYLENMIAMEPGIPNHGSEVELQFAMQPQQISEVTGAPVYQELNDETIPLIATIFDITDDQPLTEASIIVFADDQIQDKLTTWNSGSVTINAIPGQEYQLVVQRDGYNDRIISLGQVDSASDGFEIALIPSDIKKIRQAGIDLSNANMLVMSGPTGEDQLYLSTNDKLYRYEVENDNHYLVDDEEKILLKERSRSISSKASTKQDTDQFNLRSEDQFLYDQLTADEKAMVDRIIKHFREGKDIKDDQQLAIYYHNLPPEYTSLIDKMAFSPAPEILASGEPGLASHESLDNILSENQISVSGVFNINNIYYDFDKSTIREDASRELDKLAIILNSNKSIKVMMFSHTDSRGSNKYNDGLSKRRGISAVEYLVAKGVSIDRLSTVGRGESQLANSCSDQNKCGEDAHQLNRRTEFILSA